MWPGIREPDVLVNSSPEKNKSLVECCSTRNPKNSIRKSRFFLHVIPVSTHACISPEKRIIARLSTVGRRNIPREILLFDFINQFGLLLGGGGKEEREKIQSGGELSLLFSLSLLGSYNL